MNKRYYKYQIPAATKKEKESVRGMAYAMHSNLNGFVRTAIREKIERLSQGNDGVSLLAREILNKEFQE